MDAKGMAQATVVSSNGNGVKRLWTVVAIIVSVMVTGFGGAFGYAIQDHAQTTSNTTAINGLSGSLHRIETKLDRLIERRSQ